MHLVGFANTDARFHLEPQSPISSISQSAFTLSLSLSLALLPHCRCPFPSVVATAKAKGLDPFLCFCFKVYKENEKREKYTFLEGEREMSNKTPIFPMPEPQHFSDYGFDPQIDYFQVLEEARKHKRDTSRSIDSLHFKLQKPISKDDSISKKTNKAKKKRWWKSALLFFKWKWTNNDPNEVDHDVHHARAQAFRASISGPVYITESRSVSSSPYRTSSRPSSGPLAGTMTPTRKGEVEIPYLSLRELNMEQQHRISASAMPIYLVT